MTRRSSFSAIRIKIVLENYFCEEDGEQRYQIIGFAQVSLQLMVVYVDHSNAADEVIRIISARKANAYEQALYEDQFG